jgi:hypothetical protein
VRIKVQYLFNKLIEIAQLTAKAGFIFFKNLSLPALSCLKITGPLLESLIAIAITTKTGSKIVTTGNKITISKIRFTNPFNNLFSSPY